jgi:hypothetical protein
MGIAERLDEAASTAVTLSPRFFVMKYPSVAWLTP